MTSKDVHYRIEKATDPSPYWVWIIKRSQYAGYPETAIMGFRTFAEALEEYLKVEKERHEQAWSSIHAAADTLDGFYGDWARSRNIRWLKGLQDMHLTPEQRRVVDNLMLEMTP